MSVRIKVPLSGEGRFDSTEVEKDSNTLQGIRRDTLTVSPNDLGNKCVEVTCYPIVVRLV